MVPFAGWSTATIEGREYRWLAGRSAMYLPGVPRRGEAGLRSTLTIGLERARLEQAANAVAHLFSPIRLEDLEAASGLKARALQLAFLKHHGRTPRQWILDRRLDAARFGERPSETVARRF